MMGMMKMGKLHTQVEKQNKTKQKKITNYIQKTNNKQTNNPIT